MPSESVEGEQTEMAISVQIPVQEPKIFRYKPTADLLHFLSNHCYEEYTIKRLAGQTQVSATTVRKALSVLEANDLISSRTDGPKRLVSINTERLAAPDDPITQIPQPEYHEPVHAAVTALKEELEDIVGILLYGSVAQGSADRQSDIDLWVLVRENRAKAQRTANTIRENLESKRFNNPPGSPEDGGERFGFDIDVETVHAIPQYSGDLLHILNTSIPLYTTEDFETVSGIIDRITPPPEENE